MSYDPNVPNASSGVLGGTGDLAKMKTNFGVLSGVAVKGISGLIGVDADTPASGEALVFDGNNWVPSGEVGSLSGLSDTDINAPVSGEVLTWDGTDWVNQASTLSGLTDTDIDGPVSGQLLGWDGSNWVNVSGSERNRVAIVLTGTDWFASGQPWEAIGTNAGDDFTEVFNVGGWVTTASSIEVPSGTELINVYAQIAGNPQTQADFYAARLRINDLPTSGITGYGLNISGSVRAAVADQPLPIMLIGPSIPVSGGDKITVEISGSASVVLGSGNATTWLYAEDAKAVGAAAGGGGGGSGFNDPVNIWMPDAPPLVANAHIMNDEFTTGGGGAGGLDDRWAEWDFDSVQTVSMVSGQQVADLAIGTNGSWAGIYQTISGVGTPVSGTGWTIYGKIGLNKRQSVSDNASCGLAVFQDAAGDPGNTDFFAIIMRNSGATADVVIETGRFSIRTDTPPASTSSTTVTGAPITEIWLRIRHESVTGSLHGEYSLDGASWYEVGAWTNAIWDIQEAGFIGLREAGTNTNVRCHYFRVVSGTENRLGRLPAGIVQLERVGDTDTPPTP